jgi:DNA-binding transcriptional LysR family regulator
VFSKLNAVENQLTETKDTPEGPLRVTTTVAFGSVWLTSRLKEFIRTYPGIALSLHLDDREIDLAMREADVAIRFLEPTQSDLVQRHIGTLRASLYASPEYLKERGVPRTLADLAGHDTVQFGARVLPYNEVNWFADVIAKAGINVRVALQVNSIYSIYRAVRAGIGIGSLPEYFVREVPGIVQVLPEIEGPNVDAYFVYAAELRNSTRVAVFRDFLMREMARAKSQLSVVAQKAETLRSAS